MKDIKQILGEFRIASRWGKVYTPRVHLQPTTLTFSPSRNDFFFVQNSVVGVEHAPIIGTYHTKSSPISLSISKTMCPVTRFRIPLQARVQTRILHPRLAFMQMLCSRLQRHHLLLFHLSSSLMTLFQGTQIYERSRKAKYSTCALSCK